MSFFYQLLLKRYSATTLTCHLRVWYHWAKGHAEINFFHLWSYDDQKSSVMTTEDQSPDWTVDQCFRSVSSDPDVSQTPAPQIHRPSVNPTVKRFMTTWRRRFYFWSFFCFCWWWNSVWYRNRFRAPYFYQLSSEDSPPPLQLPVSYVTPCSPRLNLFTNWTYY